MITDKMMDAFANSFWPTSSEIVIDRYGTYIRAALEAALSASDAEPVCTVAAKALEWVYVSYGGIAHTPFGMYEARFNMHGRDTSQYEMIPAGGTLPVSFHDSLKEAKAAAQADYDARVRSALVSPADTSPVIPEGWQLVPNEPTAYLVKRYSNDGVLFDTELSFTRPIIHSTARTEFEPLYLAAAPKEASHDD